MRIPGSNHTDNMHHNAATVQLPCASNFPVHTLRSWQAQISPQAAEDISFEIAQNGLAHLAWGSKPAFLLESADDGGCWQHFAPAINGSMNYEFVLLPSAHNARLPEAQHSGYLLNIANTLKTINDYKPILTRRFSLPANTAADVILRQHILPLLANKEDEDNEYEITALMLGYGYDSIQAYETMLDGDHTQRHSVQAQNTRLNKYITHRLHTLSAQNPMGVMAPGIPSFIKSDTPRTRMLIEHYLHESAHIQQMHSRLLTPLEAETPPHHASATLDREKIWVAALMSHLFQRPPQGSGN